MQHLLAKQRGLLLERLDGGGGRQRRSWSAAATGGGTTATTPAPTSAQSSPPPPPPPRHNELVMSPSNRYVKHCVKLRDSPRHRWEHGATLLVGATLLSELAEAGGGGGAVAATPTPTLPGARVLFVPAHEEEEGGDGISTKPDRLLRPIAPPSSSCPVVRASPAVLRALAGVPTAGEGADGEDRLAAAVVDLPLDLVSYVKAGVSTEQAVAEASRVLLGGGRGDGGDGGGGGGGGGRASARRRRTKTTTPTTAPTTAPLRLLALEGVQDPGNLGTLLRTAAAFGWGARSKGGGGAEGGGQAAALGGGGGAWLLPGCADPFGAKAVRAARGAQLRQVPLVTGPGAGWDALEAFAEAQGARLVAAALPGQVTEEKKKKKRGGNDDKAATTTTTTTTPHSTNSNIILVLGSEGQGLSEEALRRCNASVSVPMVEGAMESLNVAVAGAVLMFALGGGGGGVGGGAREGRAAAAAAEDEGRPPRPRRPTTLVDRLLRDVDALI
jgi:RNA methyltransferase, TrmH family